MSIEPATMDHETQEGFEPYRAVSKAAVVSLVLGALSALGLTAIQFLLIGPVGFVLGLLGWRSINRYPAELTGKPAAMVGTILSLFFLIAGVAKHTHEYATEVPEGYTRITFRELQPERRSQIPVPQRAVELNGKQVFVKGYLHANDQGENITQFVLVPDMGACCFGGQPKLTDMIQVTLDDPLVISYRVKKRKFTGVLKVDTRLKPVTGLNGVYYQLQSDWFK